MIKKIIFRDLHNTDGNAGIASIRFYDENKELIQSGSIASGSSNDIAKYMNMTISSDYYKTTTKTFNNDGKTYTVSYYWTVDKAFNTSKPISTDNCWISSQTNTSDTLKVEFLIPVYRMSQIKFITSNEDAGGDAPKYKLTQPFYIDFYDEMNALIHSYEVVPNGTNALQTFNTNELDKSDSANDSGTIWNVWIRPFRLINDQFVFYKGETVYGPTPAVCPPCNTNCPSYDFMMSNPNLNITNPNIKPENLSLDFWMLYDSFSNSTNSLEQAKKVIYDLITINGYEEEDIMLACEFPIRIGLN